MAVVVWKEKADSCRGASLRACLGGEVEGRGQESVKRTRELQDRGVAAKTERAPSRSRVSRRRCGWPRMRRTSISRRGVCWGRREGRLQSRGRWRCGEGRGALREAAVRGATSEGVGKLIALRARE